MRKIIDINFQWYFQLDYKPEHIKNYQDLKDFEIVDLPHNVLDIPYNYYPELINSHISVYKKALEFTGFETDKRVRIVFEGVAHAADVYLNDSFILRHEGGYDEFFADISDAIKPGKNIITVVVDSRENPSIPPFGNQVDYLGYGGIYREVRLEIIDPAHIESVFLKCKDCSDNRIYCDIAVSKKADFLRMKVLESNREVYSHDFAINNLHDTYIIKLPDKKLWTVDEPNLYIVRAELIMNNEIKDDYRTSFGFRTVRFENDGFYLNNKKIKLRGLNRHQSYPYVGYAMPKSIQEKDAEILKYGLGVNLVRTSHYMQSKHFLNRCDEIGLLVMEEIPGWQYIGKEEFKKNTINNVKAMIERDRNHPSIILWGVRINESPDDDELYKNTNLLARSLDDTRPTGGVRNFSGSNFLESVYTFNDFTHSGGEDILQKPDHVKRNAPYLVTEYNGHMYPTKRFDDEPHRVEQALRHYRVISAAGKDGRITGTIGWCMNDYNTHWDFGSGDGICYHGVLDMFRLEKYAAYIYQSQQDRYPVLEVLSTMNSGDYPASNLQNVYVASNVEKIKLYRDDTLINEFYPQKDSGLSHPLYVIDDWVGNLLESEEGFSKKNSLRAKTVFKAVSKYGMNLPLKYKLMMLMVLKNQSLTIQQAIGLYYKYYGGIHRYRFEGYIGGKLVKTVIKEPVKTVTCELCPDKKDLIVGETYDATRITVKKMDQNQNLLVYASDGFTVDVSGGIDLIGPRILSLSGGTMAFWVKTNNQSNQGTVTVRFANQILAENIYIKRGKGNEN